MALPKLAVPEFELELPSTGEKIRYRPFLVKEEKVLLMALEGNDEKEMARALKNIIAACIMSERVDVDNFAPFDIEYFFLNLRGKSVGETVELNWPCQGPECSNVLDLEIDVSDIKCVKNPEHTTQIKLTEHIGLMMKYPSIDDMANNSEHDTEDVDKILEAVAGCVESVYSGDSIDKAKDLSSGELSEWLGTLTQPQFMHIQAFFDTMPKVCFDTTIKCKKCKHKNEIAIEGMKNFFG